MSSRLLNMKFMQRAAASNPASPSTPTSERPSKRQRLSTGSAASPATPVTPVDPGEIRQQQANDRAAAEAGETKWVLSVQQQQPAAYSETPMKVVTAGFGAIDSASHAHLTVDNSDSEVEQATSIRPSLHGRRSFGKFNKALERQQNPDLSSSEAEPAKDSNADSDDSEDDDDEDDDDPASAMVKQQRKEAADKIRQERKAKEKADKAEAERLARERRKKEINLNKDSRQSISSGGQRSLSNAANMECHTCGEKGHVRAACPQRARDMDCHTCGEKGHLMADCPQKIKKKRKSGGAPRPWDR